MPEAQVNYKRIFYSDFQPTSGSKPTETLIFMHGLGSSQNYYQPLISRLIAAPTSFRCITFDNTGAARSPYSQIEQNIESLAADLLALLDLLKVEKAVVVGHSMGAIVACHLAASRSNKVVAAVLIGPVLPSPAVAEAFQKRIEVVEKNGMEAMANTIPTGATGSRSTPLHHAFIRELLLGQNRWGYISNCRVIAQATPPDYGAIKVTILIIAGEDDKAAPLAGCQTIFERIGTEEKRIVVLKGVGHWHVIEASDEVGREIVSFYKDIQ